ncbi:MAG: acetate--CoA ligase [Phycisphaerales bacterium]|nr:acetate--CoA ligase [Planctomycetota bacterium]MCH8509502.1 acetate--CoA ligase [Phycisphaerales bacterium]
MSQSIESTLHENRVFQPPAPEAVGAPRWLINSLDEYDALYRKSIDDPEPFWDGIAKGFDWITPYTKVLEWSPPDARWFVGGQTNVCHNCVDRQVETGHAEHTAIIWEGEPAEGGEGGTPEIRRLTYADLQRDTARLANVLKSLGVRKGDVVTIYMGMVPELAVAMLACARIGAPHSVIFGGFSAQAIADRVQDAGSKVILTCDGAWRRGKVVPLKDNVDDAIKQMGDASPVEHVLCFGRCHNKISWGQLDRCWHEETEKASDDCPCEPMDSEDMLFLLYTSGSTGKPKGIVHTTAGYMVHTATTARYTFNLIPDQNQVFWCTADCGWITGHSYIVYGILPNRVPTLMYEGGPDYPTPARFWQIVERHKVTQFYTAPTAIRAFMKWGDQHPATADLSTLQVLGTVGEPINPEAWMWYRKHIGRDACPIVDTYWQTETGGHAITPLPGATPCKPGSCTRPFFGIDAAIVDTEGNEQPADAGGLMVIRKPWPGMLRGIHGDRQRFIDTYWSTVIKDGVPFYTAGDGARRDADGNFWIMGRIDDVINVSGHRLGTMEVESALVGHSSVVEAAVVGMPHEIKGTGIAAFVTLANGVEPGEDLIAALREHVSKEIGPIAKPDQIRFAAALPKTRSGKIMRRLLRSIAAGETELNQDTSTLEDFSVVAKLKESEES